MAFILHEVRFDGHKDLFLYREEPPRIHSFLMFYHEESGLGLITHPQ